MWVVIADDTVGFLLEPTRLVRVPRDHLGQNPEGIINADRYSAYKALGFSAAAWKVAPCDQFIGWDDGQRRRNLHRIANHRQSLLAGPGS